MSTYAALVMQHHTTLEMDEEEAKQTKLVISSLGSY